MSKNFVSYEDSQELMGAIKKKLYLVTDAMPTASAELEGKQIQYIGSVSPYVQGAVYECQEVTPATNPKTYHWVELYKAEFVLDNVPTKDSNNAVKSGGVYASEQKLYKIDAAYGVKNLAPRLNSQTINNVTFDINDDGSITVNGTATSDCWYNICGQDINNFLQTGENYIASGCPEGGSDATFFMYIGGSYLKYVLDDTWFTCDAAKSGNLYICVRTNTVMDNVVFYPMIRLASYVDDTYEPYAKTNQQLTVDKAEQAEVNDIVNVYGAKNLIPYPYIQTTRTVNNVTFTDNGDGTITVDTGTNTASAGTSHNLNYPTQIGTLVKLDKNKTYLLTDATKAGVDGSYILSCRYYAEGVTPATNTGTLASCTASNNWTVTITNAVYAYIYIWVVSGKSVSNVIFKPMIRLASIQDDTYEPYVPTNRQLLSHYDNGILGAKNLLHYPYVQTTQTKFGVTFTDNGDGTLTISGTQVGSSSADRPYFGCGQWWLTDKTADNYFLKSGSSIIASISTSNDNIGIRVFAYNASGTKVDEYALYGAGEFNIGPFSTDAYVAVCVETKANGSTFNNVTVYPMLRLASDSDNTYQPYAMTNKQLTDKVRELEAALSKALIYQ